MIPPQKQLAVILVPRPASAPVVQQGSFVQKGFKDKGSGSERGVPLCDPVMPEARESLLYWMDGAMFRLDQC